MLVFGPLGDSRTVGAYELYEYNYLQRVCTAIYEVRQSPFLPYYNDSCCH